MGGDADHAVLVAVARGITVDHPLVAAPESAAVLVDGEALPVVEPADFGDGVRAVIPASTDVALRRRADVLHPQNSAGLGIPEAGGSTKRLHRRHRHGLRTRATL